LRALVEHCNLSCNTVDDGQQVSVHSCFEICDLQLKLEDAGVDLGAVASRLTRTNTTNNTTITSDTPCIAYADTPCIAYASNLV
jgi:hypothetical protein